MNQVLQVFNITALSAVDLSLGDESSETINIQGSPLYAVEYEWADFSGTCSVSVGGSNTGNLPFPTVDTFLLSGVTGKRLLNVEKAGYAYLNISYDATGAAGTLTVTVNGKAN